MTVDVLRLAVALSFFGATAAHAQIDRPIADEVIERIKRNAGVPWRESTVDTFKAGDPGTP